MSLAGYFRQAAKQAAQQEGKSKASDEVSVPTLAIVHRYNASDNTIRARTLASKNGQPVILSGVYRMAYPHHILEMFNPQEGDRVIIFSARHSDKGFAFLDYDSSETAYDYARVGGQIFIPKP